MNYLKSKSRWLATGLALAFLAGLTNSPAAEQEKKGKTKEQPDKPTARPDKPTTQPTTRPDGPKTSRDKMKPEALGTRPPPVKSPPAVTLETKPTANGGYIKTTPSMQRREVMEKKPDGEHTQRFTPTGRIQSQEVRKQDGTLHPRALRLRVLPCLRGASARVRFLVRSLLVHTSQSHHRPPVPLFMGLGR